MEVFMDVRAAKDSHIPIKNLFKLSTMNTEKLSIDILHWSTKFHFLWVAEMKCANSYVNSAAEHENHYENASLATVFELSCLTCTT
jgi:hypothetical protein